MTGDAAGSFWFVTSQVEYGKESNIHVKFLFVARLAAFDTKIYNVMRILVTAGPTREYLDDVRFLSNASSGRMGYSITEAAIVRGHEVVLVTGPVELPAPAAAEVHPIETTDELKARCLELFPQCDGVIATAAVCDFRPRERVVGKMTKTGQPITLELVETSDILAELGDQKAHRWVLGFALESQDPRTNAMRKLRMKHCDCIAVNDTGAISSLENDIEILSPGGETMAVFHGLKTEIAGQIIDFVELSFPVTSDAKPDVRRSS